MLSDPYKEPPPPAGGKPTNAEVDRLRSVCPECGEVFDRFDKIGACPRCQPSRRGNTARLVGKTAERGYDHRWRRLSERARALQQFCSDCGSVHDLTVDHTPEAWERRAAGKAIRLVDIDVVCRRCNSERGAARGDTTTDRHIRPDPFPVRPGE